MSGTRAGTWMDGEAYTRETYDVAYEAHGASPLLGKGHARGGFAARLAASASLSSRDLSTCAGAVAGASAGAYHE